MISPRLPAKLRLYRHERRWWRKHARMYAESDVLVITHTKSGSTWLRAMISHLLHLEFGVPVDELIHFDNFHGHNAAIPRLHFVRDTRFVGRHGAPVVDIAQRQK